MIEILNDEIGICSLSRNPLNLLMWAHYASSHTGFVVEFSVFNEHLPLNDAINCSMTCFLVTYKKDATHGAALPV